MLRQFYCWVCLTLVAVVMLAGEAAAAPRHRASTGHSAPLPHKTAPPGMLEVPTGGRGRILTARMSGSASARKMLMALRIGIANYFDARPVITTAFADRADQNVQASFIAKLGHVPVRGVIAIGMHGDTGQATLVFDRASTFRQSFAALLRRVNGSPAGGGGRHAPQPVHLTMTPLLDGSGQIGLPPGWRVTGSYKGTVDAVGPDGAVLGLGGYALCTSPQTGGLYPGIPMVDFSNPVRAALDYTAFQNAQARRRGLPETRITKIWDTKPISMPNGRAAFIRFSFTTGGKPYDGLGLYSIMPTDQTQAILYMSYAMAPATVFKKDLPGMWAAWQSWGVKDAVLRERVTSAVQSMRETGDILTGVDASRQESYAHVNKAWDQYIRDESSWSDPSTGKRYTVPNSVLPPDGNTGGLVPVPLNQL